MGVGVALMPFLSAFALVVNADMYLQNPRGSNNRLNERGRERSNANRMFDSQNNNRGGYNVGNMRYYAGSKLPIQWTNQHSCNDPNNNCEIIIQYMCEKNLRDGTTTRTIPDNERACRKKNCNTDNRFGMHEDYDYYQRCKNTQRNNGLFTADQQLKGKTSQYTRQNSQGTRRGYECPEERDYYPHWNPNPWRDIAILTNDVSRCDYYKSESQNVKSKWACDVPETYLYRIRGKKKRRRKENIIPISKSECEAISGAKWKEHPAHNIPKPDCQQAPWSRDNHHGNGKNGFMNIYNWTIPNIIEDNCAIRIRYNISTNDYDSWNTFSDKNGENGQTTKVDISGLVGLDAATAVQRGYVFKNNPTVQLFPSAKNFKLKLALNTAQYGRTFEDRSFRFSIAERPSELKGKTIYNLNVRGKRGNIVQVYPAVEYDFVPNRLLVSTGDYIHFQWTGSDRNPGNNAGQGRAGTDRSNVILLEEQIFDEGMPKASDIHGHYGRSYPENLNTDTILGLDMVDLKKLAFLQPGSGDVLDKAPPYFDLGPRKVTRSGTYFYMCTRNNNFSNRSQKGKIIVQSASSDSKSEQDVEAWFSELDGQGEREEEGDLTERDENHTVENQKDNEAIPINMRRVSIKEAEDIMAKRGGSINEGDGYASDFVSVETGQTAKGEQKMWIDLPLNDGIDSSSVTVYYSKDAKTWESAAVQDVTKDKRAARVKASSDGFYVARYAKDNSQMIAKDEEAVEKMSKVEKDFNDAKSEETTWSIDQWR